jgi:predicted Rdx family selenoprotein
VERKTTKVEQEVEQPTEIEQLANFSLAPVEGGFFDVEVDSHVVVPTKAQSKYMMRHKGKEQVEECSSPTKVI